MEETTKIGKCTISPLYSKPYSPEWYQIILTEEVDITVVSKIPDHITQHVEKIVNALNEQS